MHVGAGKCLVWLEVSLSAGIKHCWVSPKEEALGTSMILCKILKQRRKDTGVISSGEQKSIALVTCRCVMTHEHVH